MLAESGTIFPAYQRRVKEKLGSGTNNSRDKRTALVTHPGGEGRNRRDFVDANQKRQCSEQEESEISEDGSNSVIIIVSRQFKTHNCSINNDDQRRDGDSFVLPGYVNVIRIVGSQNVDGSRVIGATVSLQNQKKPDKSLYCCRKDVRVSFDWVNMIIELAF